MMEGALAQAQLFLCCAAAGAAEEAAASSWPGPEAEEGFAFRTSSMPATILFFIFQSFHMPAFCDACGLTSVHRSLTFSCNMATSCSSSMVLHKPAL